ncbi:hypothetical protein MUN81_06800 [Hymenobacter sp. 5317J-9]|uniref:hypothetical protein n=1 Tax=Hymenobacter sp. 5317J-9 TaxID=2932250 RepID=UPI001FD663E0|nr:hypothetical protein [Hymenobacter sp. 5317J-9]UOQ99198.1 hypothetical protein MUN81_06800 [Hymenobacter sp. 5317J-9]
MKRNKIIFTANVDLDGDCTFDIDIIRPDVRAHAYFYGDADTFIEFGNKLVTFPQNATETVCFEWGEVGNPSSFGYLRIEAYCASPAGHTALRIIVDNNGERAERHRFEFSILSEAASINKLGALLTNWQVETTSQLVWKAETR